MFRIFVFALIGICVALPTPASNLLSNSLGILSAGTSNGASSNTLGGAVSGLTGAINDGSSNTLGSTVSGLTGALSGGSSSDTLNLDDLIAGLTDGSKTSSLNEKIPALLENVNSLASGAVTGLNDSPSLDTILNSATSDLPEGLDVTLNDVTNGLSSNDPVNAVISAILAEVNTFNRFKQIGNLLINTT